MRVALLTNVLTPYRLPVYRDLASTPGWRLRVMVSAETDATWSRAFAGAHERGAGELDVAVVRSLALRRRYAVHASADATQHVTTHVPLGALAALQRFRPDIVVSAELGPRTLLAAAYAALASRPLVIWSYQSRAAADAAGGLHNALRRALLTRADAVVGMGRQAREVLRALGVAGEHLFDAPNAHDATALEAALAATEPTVAQAALRGGFGCRPRVALVLGRLVAAKGLRPLLAAWERLPAGAKRDWTLLFVGDGPLRGEIAAAARRAEPGEIVATGAVPAADVAALYAGVDLLVFPSLGDPWGLVVNEALASGLPVLCSSLAGCADDLVRPGENGWLCDPTDAASLDASLARALQASPDALVALGERGRDMAKRFSPEAMAAGLRRAVMHAAARPGRVRPRSSRSTRSPRSPR